MDVSSLISGLRVLPRQDAAANARLKLSSLETAYNRLVTMGYERSFDDFLRSLPASLSTTYFATRGLDQHYTTLLAGLGVDQPRLDVWLATVLNYILQELTYQGRYLARAWPETFVWQGSDTSVPLVAVANTERVANFRVGPDIVVDDQFAQRMGRFALNVGDFVSADAATVAARIPQAPDRSIGCLAFTDLTGGEAEIASLRDTLATLEPSLTQDTFYVFAGEAEIIFGMHAAFEQQSAGRLMLKAYHQPMGGALLAKALLVLDGCATLPQIPDVEHADVESFEMFFTEEISEGRALGLEMVTFHPTEEVKLQEPTILSSGAPLSNAQISTISTSLMLSYFAAVLKNGLYICSETPFNATHVVATEARQIVHAVHEPSLLPLSPYFAARGETAVVPRRPMARVPGKCIPLAFSPAIHAYHSHFLLQCFPRIEIARAMGIFDSFSLLVPATLRTYQKEMFLAAGLRPDQLVFMDPAYDYQCDELIVPNVIPAIFTPFYTAVYDRLIDSFPPTEDRPYRKILISRAARTTWRNMTNYDAICELLVRECGFEVVAPEKLSLRDEIELFRSASIVVGAEGAGLYNCCFMRPGTDVVCLADQDYVMYVLGSIAKHRGFNCSFVFGESFQADSDLTRRAGHADFIVDPERVKTCVEDLIERRNAGVGA